MPRVITDLTLKSTEAFSVVDEGASPDARIVIYKRKLKEKPKMSALQKILKALGMDDEKLEKQSALEAVLEKLSEEDAAVVLAAMAEMEAKKAADGEDEEVNKAEDDEEEIEKSKDLPIEVRKALAERTEFRKEARALRKEIEILKQKEADKEIENDVEALTHLPMQKARAVKLLKMARSVSPSEYEELKGELRAMSEQAKASAVFKTYGRNSAEPLPGSPEEQIQKRAEEIRRADPSISIQKARVRAAEENPRLYEEMRSVQ